MEKERCRKETGFQVVFNENQADCSAVAMVLLATARRRLDDVIDPQNHFGRLRCRQQHLPIFRNNRYINYNLNTIS